MERGGCGGVVLSADSGGRGWVSGSERRKKKEAGVAVVRGRCASKEG